MFTKSLYIFNEVNKHCTDLKFFEYTRNCNERSPYTVFAEIEIRLNKPPLLGYEMWVDSFELSPK